MSGERSPRVYLRAVSDFVSVAAPVICLFDCIVLPAVSIALPFAGVHGFAHGISDQVITAVVLAICLPAIVPGFLKHRSKRVLIMFSSAAALMFFVNFGGHQIDHALHTALMLAVSALLITANYENRKLVTCGCSGHGVSLPITSGSNDEAAGDWDEAHAHDHQHHVAHAAAHGIREKISCSPQKHSHD